MFRADVPVAGFYQMRIVKGGLPVGIKIWHGAPLDPETGDELDRSHRWQALANGEYLDFDRAWPACAASPITEAEYSQKCKMQRWAKDNAPDSAYANPAQKIDYLKSPLPF